MTCSLTIITSTYNCKDALRQTAASIRAQCWPALQWIIMDGGSIDGTLDVIRENEDLISYWRSEPDQGIYDAWNKACRLALGEWVLFLGAGDLLYAADTLMRVSLRLTGVNDALLAYGGVSLIDADGRELQVQREVRFDRWCQGRPVLPCHQGVFQHRSLLERPHPFDSRLRICADAKLMLEAMSSVPPVYLGFDVAKMMVGGISSTAKGWSTMARENRQICRDLGLHPPLGQRIAMLRLYAKLGIGKLLGTHAGVLANAYRRLTGRKSIY